MATILHSALTGSEAHEPKGADTASAGDVYVADGTGSGAWRTPSFSNNFDDLAELQASIVAGGDGVVHTTRKEGFSYVEDAASPLSFNGVGVRVSPKQGTYVDLAFGVIADGVSDDTNAYTKAAEMLPDGATFKVTGGGTRILSSEVLFEQDNLNFVCDIGARFKQADNTQSIDRYLHFTGDRGVFAGGIYDQNLTNNLGPWTGRMEGIRFSGDYWNIRGCILDGSHDSDFGTTFIVTGSHCLISDITTYRSGRNAIRDWGDYNTFRKIRMLECMPGESGVCHGFVKDNGPDGAPFNLTTLDDVVATSDAAHPFEGILFDHDGVKGSCVRVSNVWIDAPNSTGPDVMKFAYVHRVEMAGIRLKPHNNQDANSAASLRFQQGVEKVHMDNCVLAGSINFDADVDCDLTITGNSVVGNETASSNAIEGFRGVLVVADGVEFRKVQNYFIALDGSDIDAAYDTKIILGRCGYHGYGSARIVSLPGTGTSGRRVVAGNISVAEPISQEGVRTNEDGSWITSADQNDAACQQVGTRKFVAHRNDLPPRDAERRLRGDTIRDRDSHDYGQNILLCETSGADCRNEWAASAGVSAGTWRHSNGNVYKATSSGTTGATAPSGTGSAIDDGSVTWDYVDALATYSSKTGSGTPESTAGQIGSAAAPVNVFEKFKGKQVFDTTNNRVLVASGPSPTDVWYVVDGSVSATPT